MPAVAVWIVGALGWVLRFVLARIIFMVGIQAVTVVGLGFFLADLKDAAILAYQGLPAAMLQILGLLRIDQAVLIIFAAYTARVTMGAAQDSVTKIVSRGPQAGQL